LQNAEFQKGVFCRILPVENLCGIRCICRIKIAEDVLVVELCQFNKCKILQSARPPCSQASLCFAGGDSRLIFIIVLVGLRYLDLVSG